MGVVSIANYKGNFLFVAVQLARLEGRLNSIAAAAVSTTTLNQHKIQLYYFRDKRL
jgi:hypothetical protein